MPKYTVGTARKVSRGRKRRVFEAAKKEVLSEEAQAKFENIRREGEVEAKTVLEDHDWGKNVLEDKPHSLLPADELIPHRYRQVPRLKSEASHEELVREVTLMQGDNRLLSNQTHQVLDLELGTKAQLLNMYMANERKSIYEASKELIWWGWIPFDFIGGASYDKMEIVHKHIDHRLEVINDMLDHAGVYGQERNRTEHDFG